MGYSLSRRGARLERTRRQAAGTVRSVAGRARGGGGSFSSGSTFLSEIRHEMVSGEERERRECWRLEKRGNSQIIFILCHHCRWLLNDFMRKYFPSLDLGFYSRVSAEKRQDSLRGWQSCEPGEVGSTRKGWVVGGVARTSREDSPARLHPPVGCVDKEVITAFTSFQDAPFGWSRGAWGKAPWLSQGQPWPKSFCPLLSCLETPTKQTESLHMHTVPLPYLWESSWLSAACTTDQTVGAEGGRMLTRRLPRWYLLCSLQIFGLSSKAVSLLGLIRILIF